MNTKRMWWLLATVMLLVTLVPSVQAFYDPGTQRWVNRDPFVDYGFQEVSLSNAELRGDGNIYVFVDNSPIFNTDSLGLQPTFKGCREKQKMRLRRHSKRCQSKVLTHLSAAIRLWAWRGN